MLDSCEVIDARGPTGSYLTESPSTEFKMPKLKYKRSHHHSMIIDNKWLFVFFGKEKQDFLFSQSLEYIDLD